MGLDINWGLVRTPDYQGNVDRAFGEVDKMQQRNALAQVVDNPDDPKAIRELLMRNPELGMKMQDRSREQQGRNALSGFLNALGGNPGNTATPSGGTLNALMTVPGTDPAGGRYTPGIAPTPRMEPGGAGGSQQRPRSARAEVSFSDPLFRDLVRLDPDQASKIATMYGSMGKAEREREDRKMGVVGSLAMHLKTIPQEQRHGAMMQMERQLRAAGFTDEDFADNDLTDDELDGHATLAMDVKTILGQNRNDRRLEWDMDDDEADNARADRNTASMIGSRAASTAQGAQRVGIQREGMQRTDARGRRGQDMNDRRMRESASFRGKGGKGGSNVVSVQTPEQARALKPGTLFRTPDGKVKVR